MRQALEMALEALSKVGYVPDAVNPHPIFVAITAIKEALAQPEFVTHTVEQSDDWSEWVCPDPKGYFMKCCDCGLVHEAEFRIVRYKSETEREDCDFVDDLNLQAVFRMRRSEQWSPEDTAHRAGGLPMAQPEQRSVSEHLEPVAKKMTAHRAVYFMERFKHDEKLLGPNEQAALDFVISMLEAQPSQRKPLTDEEMKKIWYDMKSIMGWYSFQEIARAIEAAHGIKE